MKREEIKKMNYKEFCDYVEENILEFVPPECGNRSVEIKNVTKFPTSTIKNHLYNIRYNFNGFVTLK